ncbi:hypothetical protein D9757_013838 [Collybiopsis confluens]|uniref:Uncharacterized protein n=1 Tax=Collybiopsis confluens TaxID=2823264 RepID=A0A8H5GD28_9AGAR|nr:hypothetical protein D9757_013838 [Collybiopsis confluens]
MDSSNRPQNLYYWPSDDQDGSTIPVIPLETPISSPGPDPSLSKSSSLPPESESFPSLSRPPPTAKSMDVSSIHGNVSDKAKRFVVNLLNYHYYGGVKEESFGLQVGRRLKLKSMNVWAPSHAGVSNVSSVVVSQVRIPKRATEAQTVFEIIVAKDMCNPFGTLHGACACYIVDP